jgi:hypothetical protein
MLHHESASASADDAATRAQSGPANSSLTLDWASIADVPSLLLLFQRAFGHAMPAEQWRWKYTGLEPMGSVVRRGNETVAFYGGIPRRILHFGELRTAVQISDVMVLPAERGILTRRGAFFLTASAYADRYVGPDRPYALAFGFPSERHARLGEHLGLYARVDEILEASWTALDARASVRYKARLLQPHEVSIVDELWHRMSGSLDDLCIGVRDAAHVAHRFLAHPTVSYLPLLITHRFTGRAIGLLVLRDHADAGLELVDTIAEPSSIAVLVRIGRRVAARLGRRKLFAWLTPAASAYFDNPAVSPAGVPVPTIIWGASPDLAKLRGHWWLTGGDSDFR